MVGVPLNILMRLLGPGAKKLLESLPQAGGIARTIGRGRNPEPNQPPQIGQGPYPGSVPAVRPPAGLPAGRFGEIAGGPPPGGNFGLGGPQTPAQLTGPGGTVGGGRVSGLTPEFVQQLMRGTQIAGMGGPEVQIGGGGGLPPAAAAPGGGGGGQFNGFEDPMQFQPPAPPRPQYNAFEDPMQAQPPAPPMVSPQGPPMQLQPPRPQQAAPQAAPQAQGAPGHHWIEQDSGWLQPFQGTDEQAAAAAYGRHHFADPKFQSLLKGLLG
jgi:hypothetical protein